MFRSDAAEYAAWMKARCAERGLVGVFPADIEIDPAGLGPAEFGAAIFARDVRLIDECDVVVADLNAFRGAEPDSGTCFELGYAFARGKRLFGYTTGPERMADRVHAAGIEVRETAAGPLDGDGLMIEDGGGPLNLMLAVPAMIVIGGLEDCLDAVASSFSGREG